MRLGEITKIKITPVQESINPELKIDVPILYTSKYEIPLNISGVILSEDNKKLSNLTEVKSDISQPFELNARSRDRDSEEEVTFTLVANLNRRIIDHVEDLRAKDRKGDIKIKLILTVKTLETRASLSHMCVLDKAYISKDMKDALKGEHSLVGYHFTEKFSSERTDMWVISGDGSPTFLQLKYYDFQVDKEIKSNDWLHDFCPIFQIGKFAVFEFQLPETIEEKGDLPDKINEAIKSIENMEKDLKKCEWNRVIEDARPIFELLKNTDEIKDLFQRDGYTEEAINDLSEAIKKLFNFSSKFHHKMDRKKKLIPEIKASKEDAYLIYSTGLAFCNAISKKIQRLDID